MPLIEGLVQFFEEASRARRVSVFCPSVDSERHEPAISISILPAGQRRSRSLSYDVVQI